MTQQKSSERVGSDHRVVLNMSKSGNPAQTGKSGSGNPPGCPAFLDWLPGLRERSLDVSGMPMIADQSDSSGELSVPSTCGLPVSR